MQESKNKSTIVAEYSAKGVTWQATNKGIIRKDVGADDEFISFMPYRHISSVTHGVKSHIALLITGLVFVTLGIGSYIFFILEKEDIFQLIGIGLLFISLISIIAYFFSKSSYFIFTGAGIDKEIWRLDGIKKEPETAKRFIKKVKERL